MFLIEVACFTLFLECYMYLLSDMTQVQVKVEQRACRVSCSVPNHLHIGYIRLLNKLFLKQIFILILKQLCKTLTFTHRK